MKVYAMYTKEYKKKIQNENLKFKKIIYAYKRWYLLLLE